MAGARTLNSFIEIESNQLLPKKTEGTGVGDPQRTKNIEGRGKQKTIR